MVKKGRGSSLNPFHQIHSISGTTDDKNQESIFNLRRKEDLIIFGTVNRQELNRNRCRPNRKVLVINLSGTAPNRTVDIFQFRFQFRGGTAPNHTVPTPTDNPCPNFTAHQSCFISSFKPSPTE
ncbi:hypothetical protein DVH24_005359 [Malus domestica]|uniref:Uncharacterized protein n=1 Tax=Malus domestica TaxID=3750 RepID=A0A498KJJ0_MALDO|nr:hypothetical protein DVH24_005359 [Malus domestica]